MDTWPYAHYTSQQRKAVMEEHRQKHLRDPRNFQSAVWKPPENKRKKMTNPTSPKNPSHADDIAKQLVNLKLKIEEQRTPPASPQKVKFQPQTFVPIVPNVQDLQSPKPMRSHRVSVERPDNQDGERKMSFTYILNGTPIELEKELANLRAYRADLIKEEESKINNTPRNV